MDRTIEVLLDLGQFAPDDQWKDAILVERGPCQRLAVLSQLVVSSFAESRLPDDALIGALYLTCRDHLNELFAGSNIGVRLGEASTRDLPNDVCATMVAH